MADRRRGRDEEQDRGTKDEHGIGREDEGMEDRGTKAEHGIGREDEGMEDRGTKAEHGIGSEDEGVERPIWKEPRPTEREEGQDPRAELGGGNDTDWLKDPTENTAAIDVGPVFREGADIVDPIHAKSGDEVDPAAVIWPDYKEGPESIDAETEDDDWADEDEETEVDVDVDTDEDVDTFEEVDIDDEKDD